MKAKWYRSQSKSSKSKPKEAEDKIRWINEGQQGKDCQS